MSEVKRISHLFKECFEGQPAWHGSSVLEILEDVTAEKALRRPIPDAHTIWEIVLHLIVWDDETRKCLEGDTFPRLGEEENWPSINDTSEKAWKETVEELKRVHLRLLDALTSFDPKKLDYQINIGESWTAPWSTTSYYELLHGTIHHDVYHTGQIAILKKNDKHNPS